jgi:hypothetical protein
MLQLCFPTAAKTQHDNDKLAYTATSTLYNCPQLLLQVPNIVHNATTNATVKAKHPGNKASTRNSTSGGDIAQPAHTAVQHAIALLIMARQHSTIRQK